MVAMDSLEPHSRHTAIPAGIQVLRHASDELHQPDVVPYTPTADRITSYVAGVRNLLRAADTYLANLLVGPRPLDRMRPDIIDARRLLRHAVGILSTCESVADIIRAREGASDE